MKRHYDFKNAVLCFIVKGDSVMLAKHLSGLTKGMWNGFSGLVKTGEKKLSAVRRVLFEQGKLRISHSSLTQIALLNCFNITEDNITIWRIDVYISKSWENEPAAGKGIRDLAWSKINDLPFNDMLPLERHWLRQALEGERLIITAKVDSKKRKLLEKPKIDTVLMFTSE